MSVLISTHPYLGQAESTDSQLSNGENRTIFDTVTDIFVKSRKMAISQPKIARFSIRNHRWKALEELLPNPQFSKGTLQYMM